MTEYKPGTVAKATVRGVPDVTVFRSESHWRTASEVGGNVSHYDYNGGVTDVRPLVVLDLRDVPFLGANDYPNWLRESAKVDGLHEGAELNSRPKFLRWLADQLEAQTRPAIEEPKGLGAVVEGREDNKWVRTNESVGFPWRKVGAVDRVTNWVGIDAYRPVRVLSEGVQP